MEFYEKIVVDISGLGFIFYSEEYINHIKEGENYLNSHFWVGEDVAKSTNEGKIIGIGTASSGCYILQFREGEPDSFNYKNYDYAITVPIRVRGGKIIVRDLYDLMSWTKEYPKNQALEVKDGMYSMTLFSSIPGSGLRGDNQDIVIYVNKVEESFKTNWEGVPDFWKDGDR